MKETVFQRQYLLSMAPEKIEMPENFSFLCIPVLCRLFISAHTRSSSFPTRQRQCHCEYTYVSVERSLAAAPVLKYCGS